MPLGPRDLTLELPLLLRVTVTVHLLLTVAPLRAPAAAVVVAHGTGLPVDDA